MSSYLADLSISSQKITSKNTSINTSRLPRIYNQIDWLQLSHVYGPLTVFDFGCGRKTDHIQKFLEDKGVNYVGYDPYWNTIDLDTFTQLIKQSKEICGRVPVIICSNVLNIIPEWDQIMDIKQYFIDLKKIYFITVYEGDKSDVAKMTKPDCWQQNKKLRAYNTGVHETIRKGVLTDSTNICFIR